MYTVKGLGLWILAMLLIIFGACTPKGDTDAPPAIGLSTEEIVALQAEWTALAEAPEENIVNPRANELTALLATGGPQALMPILEILKDAAGSPIAKIFVVKSLEHVMHPDMLATLLPLAESDSDTTTRACATHLLSHLDAPEVLAPLHELANDPEPRVSVAANMGLAMRGDAEARSGLLKTALDPASSFQIKEQIVVSLLTHPQPEDAALFINATQDFMLGYAARADSAKALVALGDAESLEGLKTALTVMNTPEPLLQVFREAIAALEEKLGQPPEA